MTENAEGNTNYLTLIPTLPSSTITPYTTGVFEHIAHQRAEEAKKKGMTVELLEEIERKLAYGNGVVFLDTDSDANNYHRAIAGNDPEINMREQNRRAGGEEKAKQETAKATEALLGLTLPSTYLNTGLEWSGKERMPDEVSTLVDFMFPIAGGMAGKGAQSALRLGRGLYNTTSRTTLLNRLSHPIESIKFAEINNKLQLLVRANYPLQAKDMLSRFSPMAKRLRYRNSGELLYVGGTKTIPYIEGLHPESKGTTIKMWDRAHEYGHAFDDVMRHLDVGMSRGGYDLKYSDIFELSPEYKYYDGQVYDIKTPRGQMEFVADNIATNLYSNSSEIGLVNGSNSDFVIRANEATKTPFSQIYTDYMPGKSNTYFAKEYENLGKGLNYYHGSPSRNITEFKIDLNKRGGTKDGIYFTTDYNAARDYTVPHGKVYTVDLDIKNPIVIDNGGKPWNNIDENLAAKAFGVSPDYLHTVIGSYNLELQPWHWPITGLFTKTLPKSSRGYAIDQLVKFGRHLGVNSIVLKNAKDSGKRLFSRPKIYDQTIVYDPKQITILQKLGGQMNYFDFFKTGNKIKIKKRNVGSFTRYCNGHVTEECIERGKHSSNPTTRKRATFAANARTWKHLDGGKVFFLRAYNKFANGDIKQALNEFMSTPTVETTDDTTPYITGVSNDFSGYTISDPTITSSGMRGMRNNNPGNIRISDNDWKGKRVDNTDGSFELFDSMAYGYRALFKLIKTYYSKYNLRTPRQIFLKYAPSADSNDPTKYASIVALTMGISPDTPIDINNQNQMVGLAQAITMVENGGEQGLVDDILEGLRMSNED